MSHARWLLLTAPMLVGACRLSSNAPAGTGQLTAADSLAASTPAPAQPDRLSHCPSVVAGATTIAAEVSDGIELRITGNSAAMPEIRRRAAFLARASEETAGKHRGNGGGNAQFGRCPVGMRDTKLEVNDIPGGTAIVLKPANPFQLEWLRHEVESRTAQIAAPKPFGPGLMKSCPSAVPNSQTTVTSTPSGVDVRVVESSAAGTRAIRERAKELSGADGSTASQDERCPTSIPNAKLAFSEVPGGVLVSIKPRRAEDLALVRHTIQERARSFEPVRTNER